MPNDTATPAQLHTASLAFLGDAVYSLLVREHLAAGFGRAGDLHTAATALVSAHAQAQSARKLLPHLNEEELAVFKRGRNLQTAHRPRGASPSDYHSATALEALFGYLHLNGDSERLRTLFTLAIAED